MAPAPLRIRKHEAVPQRGSYWDDVAGRRLAPNPLTGAEALEKAGARARTELARYRET